MVCERCGSPVEDSTSHFCPYCGAGLVQETAPAAVALSLGRPCCAAHPGVEAAEVCGRCGAFACAQCIGTDPAGEKLCAGCAARFTTWAVPWEQRAELGLFKAYWLTAKGVLFKPVEVFEGMAPTGRWWDPLSFAIVSTLLAFSGMALFYAVIFGMGAIGALFGGGDEGPVITGAIVGAGAAMVVGMGVVAILAAVSGAFVLGGIEHLMLMLVGAKPGDFQATVRVCCYAHAPMLFGLIPGCGAYVYPVWQVVCRILGYKGVHRTTGGKATAAVLLPIGLCCGGTLVFYAAAIAIGMATGNFNP